MRIKKRTLLITLLSVFLIGLLVGCGNGASLEADSKEPTNDGEQLATGGTLKIAIDGAPPTLDQPASAATATRDATRLIFESLVATDSNFQPKPMLAESIETDDNKTYKFHLREGIKFHNGKEMTSEDVVASMEHWLDKSSITGTIFNGATWTAENDYTVVLTLVESSPLTLDTMASAKQAAGIMPKEIIESAPPEGVEEYIGTGPFEFVEWKQDQYIHYKKFEDYQPVEMEADGLVGKKEALVDEIYAYIVTDSSTRIAGLQTGEYDVVYGVPYDNYDQLEAESNLETLLAPSANEMLIFNKVEGLSTNVELRKAINAALNSEEIMNASFPNPDFYWLDSGYMDVNISNWASTEGSEQYNQKDQEKAKQMLEDMGYDGEEFVIMTTRDYDYFYNAGVVIQEQLKQLGINATLDVYDWATLNDKMNNDFEDWDAFITSSSTVSTPPQLIALSPSFGGGVNDEKVGKALKEIENSSTLEEAQQLWDELQLYLWEDHVPIVHLGGFNVIYGYSDKVQGIKATSGPVFWNVTIADE